MGGDGATGVGCLGRVMAGDDHAAGTCFLISGRVWATAWHVVEAAGGRSVGDRVTVGQLAGSDRASARVGGMDRARDLAVLVADLDLDGTGPVVGLSATDAVPPGTAVAVTGVAEFDDVRRFRYTSTTGEWQGSARRADGIGLGQVTAPGLVRGMSGSPVRTVGDGRVVGVVSARYNSADQWMRNTVWVARTEDLVALAAGLTDAGLTDAGLTDAGLTDAGLTDAGLTDAGLDRPASTGPSVGTADAPALSLVDSSVDRGLAIEDGTAVTERGRYAALDFKFLNRGPVAAVLHHFDLRVESFEPDLTPALTFSYPQPWREEAVRLDISCRNDGWGPARDCRVTVTDPMMARLFPVAALTGVGEVASGAEVKLLRIEAAQADRGLLDRLIRLRAAVKERAVPAMRAGDRGPLDDPDRPEVLSPLENWHLEEFFAELPRRGMDKRQQWHIDHVAAIPAGQLPIRLSLDTGHAGGPLGPAVALNDLDRTWTEGELWITPDHFRYDPHPVDFLKLPRAEAVAVILEPGARDYPGYAVSRVVPAGDADRFHVLLAPRRSGTYTITVTFHTDAGRPTVSAPIAVTLRRLRNQRLPTALADGAEFTIDDDRLTLGSTGD